MKSCVGNVGVKVGFYNYFETQKQQKSFLQVFVTFVF